VTTRRARRSCQVLVAGAAVLLASLAPMRAEATNAPRPTASGPVNTTTACFTATGPDGRSYPIYSKRFTTGKPAAKTPAIVLVHGVATNASSWDLLPTWSVARSLARAGYVVVAYDRLGYRNSPYAGDPALLTVSAQQSVLHDVVGSVRLGDYTVGDKETCPTGGTRKSAIRSDQVAIVGHSSGGFITSSYPGRFRDVDAMVQANAPSGLTSTNPPGNAAVLSATAPEAHGVESDKYGPVGDPSDDGPPPAAPRGYTNALPDRATCEEFNLWRAGARADASTPLCNPANSSPTPEAETRSYFAQAPVNNVLIRRTGDIPVLLAGADHDAIMPGEANALELAAWKSNCGCDVSQFIVNETGHAFMAHESLATWVHNVIRWLSSRGLTASR
jgi:pimeloyl-ACP methyl ester carboxylesterase